MERIIIDDALNGDWLANARKMKNTTKAQRRKFVRKMERIKMITVSQEELDKIFGNEPVK